MNLQSTAAIGVPKQDVLEKNAGIIKILVVLPLLSGLREGRAYATLSTWMLAWDYLGFLFEAR